MPRRAYKTIFAHHVADNGSPDGGALFQIIVGAYQIPRFLLSGAFFPKLLRLHWFAFCCTKGMDDEELKKLSEAGMPPVPTDDDHDTSGLTDEQNRSTISDHLAVKLRDSIARIRRKRSEIQTVLAQENISVPQEVSVADVAKKLSAVSEAQHSTGSSTVRMFGTHSPSLYQQSSQEGLESSLGSPALTLESKKKVVDPEQPPTTKPEEHSKDIEDSTGSSTVRMFNSGFANSSQNLDTSLSSLAEESEEQVKEEQREDEVKEAKEEVETKHEEEVCKEGTLQVISGVHNGVVVPSGAATPIGMKVVEPAPMELSTKITFEDAPERTIAPLEVGKIYVENTSQEVQKVSVKDEVVVPQEQEQDQQSFATANPQEILDGAPIGTDDSFEITDVTSLPSPFVQRSEPDESLSPNAPVPFEDLPASSVPGQRQFISKEGASNLEAIKKDQVMVKNQRVNASTFREEIEDFTDLPFKGGLSPSPAGPQEVPTPVEERIYLPPAANTPEVVVAQATPAILSPVTTTVDANIVNANIPVQKEVTKEAVTQAIRTNSLSPNDAEELNDLSFHGNMSPTKHVEPAPVRQLRPPAHTLTQAHVVASGTPVDTWGPYRSSCTTPKPKVAEAEPQQEKSVTRCKTLPPLELSPTPSLHLPRANSAAFSLSRTGTMPPRIHFPECATSHRRHSVLVLANEKKEEASVVQAPAYRPASEVLSLSDEPKQKERFTKPPTTLTQIKVEKQLETKVEKEVTIAVEPATVVVEEIIKDAEDRDSVISTNAVFVAGVHILQTTILYILHANIFLSNVFVQNVRRNSRRQRASWL